MDAQEQSSLARFTRAMSISCDLLTTKQGMDRGWAVAEGLGEIDSNHGSAKVARLVETMGDATFSPAKVGHEKSGGTRRQPKCPPQKNGTVSPTARRFKETRGQSRSLTFNFSQVPGNSLFCPSTYRTASSIVESLTGGPQHLSSHGP